MQKINKKGIKEINTVNIEQNEINVQQKEDNIFINAWPAVILANNLIAKLKTLTEYDINSNTNNNGDNNKGVLCGKNKFINFTPLYKTPIIFKPIKNDKDKKNVTVKWLVTVKL